jgi:hypothetical protein
MASCTAHSMWEGGVAYQGRHHFPFMIIGRACLEWQFSDPNACRHTSIQASTAGSMEKGTLTDCPQLRGLNPTAKELATQHTATTPLSWHHRPHTPDLPFISPCQCCPQTLRPTRALRMEGLVARRQSRPVWHIASCAPPLVACAGRGAAALSRWWAGCARTRPGRSRRGP